MKVRLRTDHEGPEGKCVVQLYSFFNLGIGWVSGLLPRPGRFTPGGIDAVPIV
jgi:hypothetical protein